MHPRPREVARAAAPALRSACETAIAASLAIAVAGAGCALRLPPPGGAVDDQKPQVLSHSPAAGATQVPEAAPVQIVFSEKMNRKSVERALRVFPNPGRIERAWEEGALSLSFEPDAPVGRMGERVIVILGSAEDRRGNRIDAPLELAYTQEESLPRGAIEGKVAGHNRLTPTSVLLFLAPGPDIDSLAQAAPLREISPADDGTFRIGFVDLAHGAALALFALERAAEGASSSSRERIAYGPDTLSLPADSARIAGIELVLVAPDAAGSVLGRAEGFAPPAFARLTSAIDTSVTVLADLDSAGVFLLESVAPQRYRLRIHASEDAEEVALPELPDWIRVRPGEKVRLPGAPDPEPASAAPADSTRGVPIVPLSADPAPPDSNRSEAQEEDEGAP